jgi:DNA-binding XRE family transcriptional regulator
MSLTSEQIRAARAMLRMEQARLAELADISVETIRRIERLDGPVNAKDMTIYSIKKALEKEGIIFVEKGEASPSGGGGVRIAVDRNKMIVDAIVNEFSSTVGTIIGQELQKIKDIRRYGPDDMAKYILGALLGYRPVFEKVLSHILRPEDDDAGRGKGK